MPNMSGFEFLSVVRKRFPQIAVIAISGEFSGLDVPESVLADAFFEKGQYSPKACSRRSPHCLKKFPSAENCRQPKAAVWIPVKGDVEYIAVTCSSCLRTFPIPAHSRLAYTLPNATSAQQRFRSGSRNPSAQ